VTTGTVAHDIFERRLDLSSLRGRRRGLVCCPFHRDHSPSLSVDLDNEIFHCFGCGVQGGHRRFAELVGELVPQTSARRARSSPLADARREIIRVARSQSWASEGAQVLYHISDWIRMSRRQVTELRRCAEDSDDDVLVRAAHLETFVHSVEAELDDILSAGRID